MPSVLKSMACQHSQPTLSLIPPVSIIVLKKIYCYKHYKLSWSDQISTNIKSYEPNSLGEWQEQPESKEPPLAIEGAADHWNHREDDYDYYTQPGDLFRLMSPEQQQLLFENTARSIGGASVEVQKRHISNCLKADTAYGRGVADALGISLDEVS